MLAGLSVRSFDRYIALEIIRLALIDVLNLYSGGGCTKVYFKLFNDILSIFVNSN